MHIYRRSGQSLSEFAIFLAIVASVFAAMGLYVQRGLQARYRDGANYIFNRLVQEKGDGYANVKRQYDPYYSESNFTDSTSGTKVSGFPDSNVNQSIQQTGFRKTTFAGNAD